MYHEIDEEYSVNQPSFFFDENDNVLIFAKILYRIKPDFSTEILMDDSKFNKPFTKVRFFLPMQMPSGRIVSSMPSYDKVLVYQNNKIEILSVYDSTYNFPNQGINSSISAFQHEGKYFYCNKKGYFSPNINVKSYDLASARIVQLNDSLLLAINNKKGISFLNLKNDTLFQEKTLFPNTFISSYYYSDNGELLLGTFGEGIFVIPNLSSIEINAASSLRGITSRNGTVYTGSRDGSLYRFKDTLSIIAVRRINIDNVFSLEGSYNYLPEPNLFVSFGSINQKSVIKDVVEADSGFFFASNNGIHYSANIIDNSEIKPFNKQNQTQPHVVSILTDQRYTKIAYNKKQNEIYFSDLSNINFIKGKDEPKEIYFKNKPIKCNDLEFVHDQLYIATPEDGVLIYENQKLVNKISFFDGNTKLKIKKILLDSTYLYALTNKGLYIKELNSYRKIRLGSINGVIDNLIADFTIDKDNLWILKATSFYNVPINSISFKKPDLKFSIDSIVVANKNVDFTEAINLQSTEQKFILYFNFEDFTKTKDANIEYQIDDLEWESSPASKNRIDIQNYSYGEHVLNLRLRYGGETFDTKTLYFKMFPPIYLRWWFYPIILILIVVIIILFFRRKLRLQAKESRRINELNSSRLTAIQSQMNPHFVFNALNSIQHLVISGDTDNAYNYITQFANLVRRTLDYSDKERISIFQEIKLLEVYLALEKLRFKVDFNCAIHTKNIRDVQVPPMLIQPFIENAIVHGLLHKDGAKHLNVYLELFDECLICKVEDNGIGREEAKKIRRRQRGDHKSFALNAINNRFRIMNEYSEEKLGYTYEDFPIHEAVVNRVTLRIPIK